MQRLVSLSSKLGAIGAALLLLALAAIGLTLWVSWQLDGGAAAVNEAGRMRMQTWRLAQTLAAGDRERVVEFVERFDRSVALMRSGDPARPLFVPRDRRCQDALGEVEQHWQALRARWLATPAPGAADAARQAEDFVERIDRFVSAIEAQLAWLTAILNTFQFVLMAMAIAGALALLYSAWRFVLSPLARLQSGLERMRDGDLAARVEVTSGDEFGALALGFNQMAETLQGLYQNLEAKVRDKTLGLETQHARLGALYEAAAFVAQAGTLDELAHGFAGQLRRVARADAAAVRWSGESGRRFLMIASDGLPESMADSKQCPKYDACLCAQSQEHETARVIPIRPHAAEEHGLVSSCQSAGYQTLVAVPVRLKDRIVGQLNLFYRAPTTLPEDERALLDTLVTHLAGAVEGLRAEALGREAAVAAERSLLARELHDSIAQSLSFLKIQAGLLRGALRQRDAARSEQVLAELDEGIHESLTDVRELLMHFRTRTNAEDIGPALQTTLRKFEHQTGLAAHLSARGEGLPLDPDVQVQVLHVVQEALSNVRKHSGAGNVLVTARHERGHRFSIRDDGRGFNVQDVLDGDSPQIGLRIMRERAHRIGGRLELLSQPGAGTEVTLILPETARTEAAA